MRIDQHTLYLDCDAKECREIANFKAINKREAVKKAKEAGWYLGRTYHYCPYCMEGAE